MFIQIMTLGCVGRTVVGGWVLTIPHIFCQHGGFLTNILFVLVLVVMGSIAVFSR